MEKCNFFKAFLSTKGITYDSKKSRKKSKTTSSVTTKIGSHLLKTIHNYFPDLKKVMEESIIDCRDPRGRLYSIYDAVGSVVTMFLLKEGSRNAYNLDRDETFFRRNISKFLKINLMHGDSFNDIMSNLDENHVQEFKMKLIKILLERGFFSPFKYNGKYIVAFDATGIQSFSENPEEGKALKKVSKNGVETYLYSVLEAKLVTKNGFCISLGSVWLEENDKGEFVKQDCERKAFLRLAGLIKKTYKNLPIMLVADALYCTNNIITECISNNWNYIIVLKEGIQKDLYEEISLRPKKRGTKYEELKCAFLNDLQLANHSVSWFLYKNESAVFQWITNSTVLDFNHVLKLQEVGRMRWKIENEGFNTQKNLGYNVQHKYSRISFKATKNYYQCLQIAHLIEQLYLLSTVIKKELKGNITTIKCSERLRNMLVLININQAFVNERLNNISNFKYE